jgi:membrane-associated phospholipid phosphatase
MRRPLQFFSAAILASSVLGPVSGNATVAGVATMPEAPPSPAHATPTADPVLEWNQIFNDTVLATMPAPNSLVTSRSAGLLAAAVFDAVNGVEREYRPLLVTERAPSRTSAPAAAIQAAYAMLVRLYPAQAALLTARRSASIEVLVADGPHGEAHPIDQGLSWGQAVADMIWTARLSDGFAPTMAPFLGSPTLGHWRPTPPQNLPGSGPQFATMTPWVLSRPSQFRPAPAPALGSAAYATDFNETRLWGVATNSMRSPEQSSVAVFWSGNGTLYWTRVAVQLAAERHQNLVENAHLFAVLHISMADASLATWDAKYRYVFWRPVTAIRSTDDDGNPGTTADPLWTPFLTTSAHPEYPSGHSNLAGAAAAVLGAMFGEDATFDATSETMAGARSFVGFSAAVAEMADARVFGGMHFRTACLTGSALGRTVAEFVMENAMLPRGGGRD